MKVVVFGADTGLGREVVTDLVFRGHRVSAVAIDHAVVPVEWVDRVRLYAGDPVDAGLVDELAAAHEVFVDALGDCRGARALECGAAATGLITAGMVRHGRWRYIGLRPDVLLEPVRGRLSWRRVVRLLVLRCGPGTRQVMAESFEAVARSPLSWTVVRCPGLTKWPFPWGAVRGDDSSRHYEVFGRPGGCGPVSGRPGAGDDLHLCRPGDQQLKEAGRR